MAVTADDIRKIRYWIRDTKESEYLFDDDEITMAFELAGEMVEQASIDLLIAKIGELAKIPNTTIGREFAADTTPMLARLERQLDELRNRFGIHTHTVSTELLTRRDSLTQGKVRAHGRLIDNPYNDRPVLWGVSDTLQRYRRGQQLDGAHFGNLTTLLTDTAFIQPFVAGTDLQADDRYVNAGWESPCIVREIPAGESVPIDDEGGELDVDIYELWLPNGTIIAPDYRVTVNDREYIVTGVIDASSWQVFHKVEIRRPRSG